MEQAALYLLLQKDACPPRECGGKPSALCGGEVATSFYQLTEKSEENTQKFAKMLFEVAGYIAGISKKLV